MAAMLAAQARWFGPAERPLHGLLHLPEGSPRAAVILCAPIGYEAWCAYTTYRTLADRLTARGAAVLRFDYDGTHDSAGHYTDPDRVAAWQASIRAAIDEFAAAGFARVALVGLRIGATLAYLAAADPRVSELVLWDPVIAGKRFVRELKALSMTGEGVDPTPSDDGSLAIAGTVHTAETLAQLARLDLLAAAAPAARVLVIERDDRPVAGKLVEKLGAEARALPGTGGILDVAVEHGRVPEAIVDAIEEWITFGEPVAVSFPARALAARMTWEGAAIREEPWRSATRELAGMLARPDGADPRTIVAFLTSGTEHHAGPGRIWVEFAREMTAAGRATLRVDFNGVGESPLRGPVRRVQPYDLTHLDDIRDIVATLRAAGYERVVLLGLCSSAWMAIHAGIADPALAGVIAVNPQLYWKPGDPIDILISEARARRGPEWQREEKLRQWHVFSALDVVGIRARAARWLGRLRVPTLLAFADRDDGITYLERRCGRRFAQLLRGDTLSLVEVPGIDHPMHRYRKRPEMYRAFCAFLERVGS
jgi:alpha-beta hydrolase superfamily lysophospholipase